MSLDVQWEGIDAMIAALTDYQNKVLGAIGAVADYIAPIMETFAKQNASWTDRTGNARQSLHGFVEEVSKEIIDIYLSHGMDYGIYLETRFQGRFAIIYPTLEAHFAQIMQMLQGIFG